MIVRMLVDLNNLGRLYTLTIETNDKEKLFATLKKYSRDVRYIENKKELSRLDKGKRVLEDGSIIRRCKFFGDKVSYFSQFGTYKANEIKRAVAV